MVTLNTASMSLAGDRMYRRMSSKSVITVDFLSALTDFGLINQEKKCTSGTGSDGGC